MSIDIELPSKQEKGPAPKPEPKAKKEKKRIRRVSPKQAQRIRENKAFYDRFIAESKVKRCYECDEPIPEPIGMNVCHLWSGGAGYRAAYLDKDNAVLACIDCHNRYERNRNTTSMKIYALAQERIPRLKLKYYANA